jgi:hypothetical protein
MLVEEKKILESKKVNFLFFQTPIYQNIVGLSEFEKSRLENWTFDFNNITDKDCMLIKEIYSPDMDIDYLKQLYDGSKVYENNGVKCLADFRSEYVNVIDGKRITYYQPSKYRNKIYVFGQCTARGTGVEDRHTIESFLQDMINKEFPNTYKVINMAVGCGSDLYDDIMHMRQV